MTRKSRIVLAVVVGAALGAAAVQGLHAQAKPKAYIVTDSEVLDAAAAAAYSPVNQAAQRPPVVEVSHYWKDCCNGAWHPSVWVSASGTAWSRRRHGSTGSQEGPCAAA